MTESEEMYLVSIARLKESGEAGPVPLSRLAADLSVLPVSVNQMIKKLEEAGLVRYAPYKGVELTETGWHDALHILRHRRLWEVFLVEHLHIAPSDADEIACRMEHIVPDDTAERLSAFLGHPAYAPQGQPIPAVEPAGAIIPDRLLSSVLPGESAEVTCIQASGADAAFLAAEGIRPGQVIRVQAVGASGSLLVEAAPGARVHLSPELAQVIRVRQPETIPA